LKASSLERAFRTMSHCSIVRPPSMSPRQCPLGRGGGGMILCFLLLLASSTLFQGSLAESSQDEAQPQVELADDFAGQDSRRLVRSEQKARIVAATTTTNSTNATNSTTTSVPSSVGSGASTEEALKDYVSTTVETIELQVGWEHALKAKKNILYIPTVSTKTATTSPVSNYAFETTKVEWLSTKATAVQHVQPTFSGLHWSTDVPMPDYFADAGSYNITEIRNSRGNWSAQENISDTAKTVQQINKLAEIFGGDVKKELMSESAPPPMVPPPPNMSSSIWEPFSDTIPKEPLSDSAPQVPNNGENQSESSPPIDRANESASFPRYVNLYDLPHDHPHRRHKRPGPGPEQKNVSHQPELLPWGGRNVNNDYSSAKVAEGLSQLSDAIPVLSARGDEVFVAKGSQGMPGQEGARGAQGKDGQVGPIGFAGPVGDPGPAGPAGEDAHKSKLHHLSSWLAAGGGGLAVALLLNTLIVGAAYFYIWRKHLRVVPPAKDPTAEKLDPAQTGPTQMEAGAAAAGAST